MRKYCTSLLSLTATSLHARTEAKRCLICRYQIPRAVTKLRYLTTWDENGLTHCVTGLHFTVWNHINSSMSWIYRVKREEKRSNLWVNLVLLCLCAAYETTPSHPHLALFTCLFLLMSFLGVAMYCTDRRRPQRVCEELEATLAVYLLHMKQLVWGCWIWLTMQWLRLTTRGSVETPRYFSRPPHPLYLPTSPGLPTP